MSVAKIFVFSVFLIMIGILLNSMIFNPIKVLGAAPGDDWGDWYTNANGKSICVCDEVERNCSPCLNIYVPQQ